MRVFLLVEFCLLLLLACGSPPARIAAPSGVASSEPASVPVRVDELDVPLPLDARVTFGKLENGLSYYVLPHTAPEKRAQVWLVVNAGSVLEDDDQRGLAHFVEHMSFNGTKRFPKHELIDFFEKSGIRFGADLNAFTSFDETVYTLQIPTDQPELLDRAMRVLRDWTDGVSFEPVDVEKERAVVLEEWRRGRGAGMRLLDKQAPVLFYGSKYAERIPIGLPEVIQTASRDTLVRYYREWYRPELMAIVAVGDFQATDIVTRIKSEFSTLKATPTPHPRPVFTLPAHDRTLVSIETDPEMPSTNVAIFAKLPHRSEKSARDRRRVFAESLFHRMLNGRLDELTRQPDAPFLSASSSSSGITRTTDSFRQLARVKEDAVERGFGALLEEVLRVERHGFTASELERAKRQIRRQYQQAVKEREKRDSREFAAELVRQFLQQEALPSRETELALLDRFLPSYTLAELNALGKTWSAASRVIAVAGPANMRRPSAEAMLGMSTDVAARDIPPYADAEPDGPLMSELPNPGAVIDTTEIAEIGVTEWKLKNGVRVIVKPTDFRNDEVRMSAFSPGGHSLVKDADYDSARFADTVTGEAGLGPFDAVRLRKALTGKVVWLRTLIRELDEGFAGRASPADLETMLQMVHLAFTRPRRDESAFAAWRSRETESVRNRRLSPEASFLEDMALFSAQNHVRRQPTTPESIARIDLDKTQAIYKDRFADASDFTFVFVGNIDLGRLKSLAETYLGSLPATGRKETWRDVKVFWPPGVKTKIVIKGTEPKSLVMLTFHGDEHWSRETQSDMRMLVDILRIRLREVLREELGGVYGVEVNGGISRRPRQEYKLHVNFGCSPENVDKLEQAVFDELKTIQTKGIGDTYISKVKEIRRREHEVELKDNAFWEREIMVAYTFGDDPRLIPHIALQKITSDRVRAAAQRYITTKQYVLGVLKPEAKPPSPG